MADHCCSRSCRGCGAVRAAIVRSWHQDACWNCSSDVAVADNSQLLQHCFKECAERNLMAHYSTMAQSTSVSAAAAHLQLGYASSYGLCQTLWGPPAVRVVEWARNFVRHQR